MTWIRPLKMDEAEGASKEIIDNLRKRGRPVSKFRLALGRRPPVLAGREAMRSATRGGTTLGLRREEMISFYVAAHGG
ncbi:MAG TPA: hypothetical protein DDZ83_09205 [Nitrospinae bacterium]|nr:hypothetical protein [Nitrospinota bacterium]